MEQKILKSLYNEYKDQVFGFALKHVKSEALARDIVQEVFLVICQKELSQVKNLRSFIFQITSNKVADHFRKRVKDEKLQQEMWTYISNIQSQSIDPLVAQEHEQIWQQALNHLTPQQKVIFQLSREEGFSHKKIAEELHLSKNTVKNHMVSAIKILKKHTIQPSDTLTIVFFYILSYIIL